LAFGIPGAFTNHHSPITLSPALSAFPSGITISNIE
jgi:hypothetical protein